MTNAITKRRLLPHDVSPDVAAMVHAVVSGVSGGEYTPAHCW